MVAAPFMTTNLPTEAQIQLLKCEFSAKGVSLKSNRYLLPATNL